MPQNFMSKYSGCQYLAAWSHLLKYYGRCVLGGISAYAQNWGPLLDDRGVNLKAEDTKSNARDENNAANPIKSATATA